MEDGTYSWLDLVNDLIVGRPILYHIIFLGGTVAILHFSIKQKDPTLFGLYATWVIGLEALFAIVSVVWLLDTAGHFRPRDFAFSIIYIFSGQWIRASMLLLIGNFFVFRNSVIRQILGPIFAIVLLSSVGVFSVSVVLDNVIFSGESP